MEDLAFRFTIGHHDSKRSSPITADVIENAHSAGYDVVTSPITTSHFHSRVLTRLSGFLSQGSNHGKAENITASYNGSPIRITPLAPEDTPLTPDESISQVIGVTSSWIDLGSPDPVIADVSRQVLQLELAYAAFCGITYVLIHGPRLRNGGAAESNVAQYARAILDALGQGPYMQLFVWLPVTDDPDMEVEKIGDLAPFARAQYVDNSDPGQRPLDLFGTWEAWNTIRSMCRYSTRLSAALSVSPRLLMPLSVQSRWYSEPVRLLTLSPDAFTKNPKAYPVLSKAYQALISRFVYFKSPSVWFLLCDVGPIPSNEMGSLASQDPTAFPTPSESAKSHSKDPTPHLSYMRHLQTKQPSQSAADRFGAGYQDYLQAPLQPLTVHLESITYEVFEKDPIKYEWYERAVARALHDWIEQEKPTSNPDGRVVVAVVGAGRGPLVTRAIQAAEAVGVDIDIWVLEKNPNAFVLLQRTNREVWNGRVSLVKSDMRTWRGPSRSNSETAVKKIFNVDVEEDEKPAPIISDDSNGMKASANDAGHRVQIHYKIDVLISELLGSFADNELSPECLDGVQHLLNPVHGISIPASYTAHITPIAAPKLHADISLTMSSTIGHAAEIPYVVMFNAIDFLSTRDFVQSKQTAPKSQDIEHQNAGLQSAFTEAEGSTAPDDASSASAVVLQTWAFHHPNPELPATTTTSATATSAPSNSHNARYSRLSFPIPHRGTCHGLGGYFETVLYPGVELSTNPLTMEDKSAGMISWFPIYFPLKTPLYIPDNATITVQMWRQTDDRKVWYEWILEVYTKSVETHTDQKTGESRRRERQIQVGSSGLHSSEKEGCLM